MPQELHNIKLNDYQLCNLRWLLRNVIEGTGMIGGLNTGDWCGEVCFGLEQIMIDNKVNPARANQPAPWPLAGFYNGEPSPVKTDPGG